MPYIALNLARQVNMKHKLSNLISPQKAINNQSKSERNLENSPADY